MWNDMCVYCGGSLQESTMDYVEKIDNYVIVIKNVPCKKCNQCGEEYFSTQAAKKEFDDLAIKVSDLLQW